MNTPRSDAREFEHLLRRPVRVQAQLLHIRLPDVEDARLHVADRLYFASGGELRYSHIHTCIGSLCVYINVFTVYMFCCRTSLCTHPFLYMRPYVCVYMCMFVVHFCLGGARPATPHMHDGVAGRAPPE